MKVKVNKPIIEWSYHKLEGYEPIAQDVGLDGKTIYAYAFTYQEFEKFIDYNGENNEM